jgi:chromosome segregation ATPase
VPRGIKRHEQPGTVAKLLAEAAGKTPPAATVESDAVATVLKIAELASAPAAFKQRLAELKKATEAARAETIAASREKVAVDKLKTDAQAEYKAHQEKMPAEREHHESWMSAAKSEFEPKAKAAKDALGQLAAGKQALSSELQRRLDAINQPIS